MTVKAKSILKDKFWIVEDDEKRFGLLSKEEDRYFYTGKSGTQVFNSETQLKKFLGKITWTGSPQPEISKEIPKEIYGYPTNCVPYNVVYDVKRRLPLFTKSEQSKSLYCAGYYIIRFDKGWVKSFCPKSITLETYPYEGPFKTNVEMRERLKNANTKRTS